MSAMGRYLKLGPIILLASLASADALANDSIRITFASGDRILQSGETSEIQVTRSGPYSTSIVEIDRLFARVKHHIERAQFPTSWEWVPPPHSDVVRVNISVGETNYTFTGAVGIGAIPKQPGEPSIERERRASFDHILEDVSKYTAAQYRPAVR